MKFPSLGRHATKRPSDPVTKAKAMMKKDGGKLADDILKLPLDSLMALPIEVLHELPAPKLILLPPKVLFRLAPGVIAKVPSTHFNSMLLQLPAEARAKLSPSLFANLPRTHFRNLPLATLWKLPANVLAQLDLARLAMLPPSRLADVLRQTPADLEPHSGEISWLRYLADRGGLALPPQAPDGLHSDQAAAADPPDSMVSPPSSLEGGPRARALTPAFPNLDDDSDLVDSTKDARLERLTRERDALGEEVARLDAERRDVSENIHRLLESSGWDDWEPDGDPFEQILEFASISVGLAKEHLEAEQTSTRQHEEEASQRLALEKTVQDLTAKLEEQTQHSTHAATQSQEEHEAEIQRLQQIIDRQDKKYQGLMQSQEERHSATVKRLIDEHTAEIGDQMTVYEKELAELRVTNERKVGEDPGTKRWQVSTSPGPYPSRSSLVDNSNDFRLLNRRGGSVNLNHPWTWG
ncbi:hypothetical protein C8A01DRAFT_37925 [Parachaetomium inaequale]|uniref:Uncharacterized protein n=1 Tax=Parachaetomium inaequale TaxID=2588326 RepID=A0AAN6PC00_9PEZI|nr:hypothetical protein C8A01DRAFT_37925 [Parachaetomium inaequale]